MIKSILLVVLLLAVFAAAKKHTVSLEEQSKFIEYQKKYNKIYSSEEYAQKFETFKANLKKIDQLNQKAKAKNADTTFAVNEFADLSKEEFRAFYLNSQIAKPSSSLPMAPSVSDSIATDIPASWDWRQEGAVTPVKNQGQCGSCWSFSTTGNVEGQWFLAGNTLTGLSEQNLVDCDHECMEYEGQKSCDAGCDGGLQVNAFNYIIKNNGIDTEASYPYVGVNQPKCGFKSNNVGAKIDNFTMIPQNETQMAYYLYQNGPLAIAADAEEWQFYFGGIFEIFCGDTLDHGILIVGYGTGKNIIGFETPFWIVKNSWGATWGEQGYLRIKRGDDKCGLANFVSSSIINH